ncbi:MAG: TonB-dependent receptor [Caulobacterales bacterium]|nr:TonB-dependent receptor [Caulobacterales bacterium]
MKRLLLTTTALLGLSTSAFAESADSTQVDEIIVTATRLESRIGDAPGVRVITSDDIADRQATFAGDILETIPGLSLSRNGDFGGVTTVRMRGASGDKTLVLIDGVVQNDPSSPNGGYDFSSLDLGDVERIEVLSGPQGSLWGSDAIGGAIAFTTRDLDGWRASAEAGSFGTVRGSAAFGVSDDRRAFGLNAAAYSSDGVSKAANGTEEDGFESWTIGANGRLTLSDTVRLDGRLRYNEAKADIDGYDAFFTFGDTADRAESRSWTGFARLTADDVLGLNQMLDVSVYDLTRDNISAFSSSYDAKRTTVRWTAGRGEARDPFAFLVGIERDDTEASISTGATADLGASSAFGVVRFAPAQRVSVTASLRHDAPDEYDAKTTARLAGVVKLDGGLTLTASYGQGFKTPTISQTVCDFCFPAGPSTGLTPETAAGWDIGLAWRSADNRLVARVTGYRLEVEDQISYGIGRYVNIDRTLTTGVEVEAEAELTDRFTVRASYAFTDAVDQSTGAELIRAPENAGSVSLQWTGDRLKASLTMRAEGEQADSDPSTFSPARRDGFAVADLAGSWVLSDNLDLTARVVNLTDEGYQQSLGYGEAGRSLFVGFRLRN